MILGVPLASCGAVPAVLSSERQRRQKEAWRPVGSSSSHRCSGCGRGADGGGCVGGGGRHVCRHSRCELEERLAAADVPGSRHVGGCGDDDDGA